MRKRSRRLMNNYKNVVKGQEFLGKFFWCVESLNRGKLKHSNQHSVYMEVIFVNVFLIIVHNTEPVYLL